MAILMWLESTAIAVWIRESPLIWAFPMILTLHTFGLGLLAGASTVLDLRLLGVGRPMPLAPMRTLVRVTGIGFGLSALTGALLFMADASADGTSMLFYTKLFFIVCGGMTVMLIKRRLIDSPETGRDGQARILAVLSLLAWAAAITAGRMLAYDE